MSHATAEMPYFIQPSTPLNPDEKTTAYEQALMEIDALLHGETEVILKMVSINCILKTHLPYYYWAGFYCANDDRLTVGPYQGTLGCLHIAYGQGVCGTVAANKVTKIVDDVHALSQGDEHIACDPNSQSEIVVPVMDNKGDLIAVYDVDSSLPNSFDSIDQHYLELIMATQFADKNLTQMRLVP